ncbi:non-specific lipid transfer protein GPI-anchored 20-like [Rutidosis leptorrhynchoides]|uniref:non-specific lipid transfer protein GPI-anchored 20-like n=1 Tax=Rutidosis leptorrhynchoides TaxID=125765 RepID=UPI003A98E5F2
MASFGYLFLILGVTLCSVSAPVYSQISTPCSASMITSFTPCLNLLANSTATSATTPISDCCNLLKKLMSDGTDCLCLLVTASVPFQIPNNRNLAISMPRACGMPGVPLQCKAAAGAPIPTPGPSTLGPAPSPSTSIPGALSPTLSPESNSMPSPPESDTTPDLTPPSTGADSGVPTDNGGNRPTVTPSNAVSTYAYSPFMLAMLIGYLLSF